MNVSLRLAPQYCLTSQNRESGAIGCTIVTDSLFWLVKQYCGASLNETFKYYTTATFIASLLALAGTFLLSFII